MKTKIIIFYMIASALFIACSSASESATEKNTGANEVYVFDDVSDIDSSSHEAIEVTVEQKVTPAEIVPETEVISEPTIYYIVQVAAFSTKEKAENYINNTKGKTTYPLSIHYKENVGLYAVQLSPFKSRAEAEAVRNELWNNPIFKDAFIVPN